MFVKLLSLVTNPLIGKVVDSLSKAYSDRLNAKTTSERIEADQRIATLEAQRSVLVAEQRSYLTAWIRPAIAFPFVVYLSKVIVYDKVLGLGVTDPLSTELTALMGACLSAFLLVRPWDKR